MPNVLLVDDEPSIRLTMGEFLRRAGYSVLIASDYDSAMTHKAEDLDVAVIDINLPGKSGIQLLQQLCNARIYIPVIMITGEPNLSVIPEIVRAGAYDFIAKPIVKDVLLNAVARAAEKKRLTDEKRRLEQEIKRYAEELETRVDERTAELIETHKRLVTQERLGALGRAAAQVAHEVKNPLAGLLLYALHLKEKSSNFSESQTYLIDKIVGTIKHLNSRVEEILGFARPVSLTLVSANVNQLVKDVLELLRPQLRANKVEVRLSLDQQPVYAMLEQSSLRGALMNLMLNAIEAMGEGGTLSIAIDRTGDSLRLEIADTGHGISDEEAKKIFEPFYTTKEQGLGLGMPYAKKIIEQHGGTISLNSRPGEGTTISIMLPAAQTEAAHAS
ncbi:MAG: two-component system, NtrC family, sensor histidine kinase HydH [Acidobacteriota bacterium]|jgi:signal transduction histidine kinase